MEIRYKRLNKGSNCHCGIYEKILYITLFGVLLWVICIQEFSMMVTVTETDINTDRNNCVFYPSDREYAIRLRSKKYSPPFAKLTKEDYKQLINLTDFTFLINQLEKCSNNNVFLLLLISSAPQHQNLRDTIRATWGQEDAKVKRIFLLGAVTDDKIQKSIESENQLHGDIVQGNFVDAYRNLTYKTVMALKYALYHCSNAIYTLKLDDDIFVNMPLMKNYLTNDLSPFGAVNLLQCIVLRNKEPIRGNTSKWYVSEQEYAPSHYPTYCQGPYALISPDVIFELYKESQKTPFFFLEDVFTYGLAASKVKRLNHSNIFGFTLGSHKTSRLKKGDFDKTNFLFGAFSMTIKDIKNFWTYVIKRPARSSLYDYSEIEDF